MKDRIPTIATIILLTLLVLGTWWASEYIVRSSPLDPPTVITHDPDSWGENVKIIISDKEGIPQHRIDGKTLRHYPDDNSLEIDNARSIHEQVDKPTMQGTANLARILDKGDIIQMLGDAHIHRAPEPDSSALDIYSSELYVYPQKDLIETDKPANVLQGDSTLKGRGMKYDLKTGQLNVFANTGAKISPNDYPKNKSEATPEINKQPVEKSKP